MKKCFLFFLFLSGAFYCEASFEYSSNIKSAFALILELKLDDAEKLLNKEKKMNSGNSLVLLYENYSDFLKAFITEEKIYADSLKMNTEKRLRLLDKEINKSPFLLYSKAEMLIQEAMIKAKFGENVSAALDIHKAYNYAEKNFIQFPTFPLNKKTLGLLHSTVGAIPREYKWLVSIAGMEGTIEQGSNELFRMLGETERGIFPEYKQEVLFYLVQIYSSIITNDSITSLLADSVKKIAERNPLMMYCFTNLIYKSGRNEEALEMMNTFDNSETFPFLFLHYKKGQLRLRKLDLGAKEDFEFYVNNFKGLNYIKSAYQKLAWISLLENDEIKYNQYMKSCIKSGITLIDDDKEALNEAETREIPNVVLLRSRLLFDGGYYKESFKEMIKITSPSLLGYRDRLEYTYRYGRLFHKTGDLNKAILNYKVTIQDGEDSHYYYAANAALMLGILYESQNDFGNAREYYQKCLSMRKHDYQNSLDQKAQARLDRLPKK